MIPGVKVKDPKTMKVGTVISVSPSGLVHVDWGTKQSYVFARNLYTETK